MIVFSSYGEPHAGRSSNVFTVRPDGTHLRQLTHYRGGTVHAFTGSFSPDGRSITFKASPTGGYEVYVMRANGTHVRQLTDDGADPGGGLAWGPAR